METVRTRQRVYFGERVRKCRDWFFEQRLRQFFYLIPGPIREAKNPVTH